jgi:hypothetical protein
VTYIRQADILPRLRDLQPGYGNVVKDAIEAIETRDAEIERLRAARNECERQYQAQVAEVGRLLDDNERLRAALEPFAIFARGGEMSFPSADDWQRASAVHTNTERAVEQSTQQEEPDRGN